MLLIGRQCLVAGGIRARHNFSVDGKPSPGGAADRTSAPAGTAWVRNKATKWPFRRSQRSPEDLSGARPARTEEKRPPFRDPGAAKAKQMMCPARAGMERRSTRFQPPSLGARPESASGRWPASPVAPKYLGHQANSGGGDLRKSETKPIAGANPAAAGAYVTQTTLPVDTSDVGTPVVEQPAWPRLVAARAGTFFAMTCLLRLGHPIQAIRSRARIDGLDRRIEAAGIA